MTNAEARFNNSLRPRKPEGSLGWTAQDTSTLTQLLNYACVCIFLFSFYTLSEKQKQLREAAACGGNVKRHYMRMGCVWWGWGVRGWEGCYVRTAQR